MKRSEMLTHMIEDIEQHLFTLEHRPNTRKHFPAILANELLDMIEGFGMLPPADYHPRDKDADLAVRVGEFYMKWEPEDEG